MKKSKKLKVFVTCPVEDMERVRMAIGDAGAGVIGNYSHCSFVTMVGKGYFCPQDGANPTIGEIGKHEVVDEAKIEFICDVDKIDDVVKAINDSHPYEEVGYDIMELLEI